MMELRERQLEKFTPRLVYSALLATGEHLTTMFLGLQKVWSQYQTESVELAAKAEAGEFHGGITDLLKGPQDPSQEPPESVV